MTLESEPRIDLRQVKLSTPAGFHLEVDELTVRAGEIVAIVGANGSGKSTLIETLLGLRRIKSGAIRVLGMDPRDLLADRRRLRDLGCQLQNNAYGRDFKVREILTLHKRLYGRTSPELEQLFAIKPLQSQLYSRLSRGQKQRTDVLVALSHSPALLVLDEPSTGLDRNYLDAFSSTLRDLTNKRLSTVVMASHSADEIELADRIVILSAGRVIAVLTMPDDLTRIVGRKRFELTFQDAAQAEAAASELSSAEAVVAVSRNLATLKVFARDDIHDSILDRYKSRLTSYAFSEVTTRDLLDVTSKMDAHA
jgi:ABC-2 type transport system ATP-binding protein